MSSIRVITKKSYCIVSSFEEDAFELAEKVEELLNDGWILSGGLASSNSKIFQALTKF